MSLTPDQKASILEVQASGQNDTNIIAMLTGCSSSAVHEFLSKRAARTPQEELRDEIDRVTDLIRVAEDVYRLEASNQNAQALRTLQSTRRDLIKDLASHADPDRDVRTLDSTILAPFLEEILLNTATFVRSTRAEGISLASDSKAEAMRAAFDNNFVLLTQRLDEAYRRVFARLTAHFDVQIDVDDLDSSRALLNSASLDG